MNAYRLDIDGLRAIAVLSVFAYHLNHSFLHGGFIGVDIFFVISGFLLSFIIFKEISTDTFSFANFYKRRIKRILPAFFFMCFVTLIVSFFILLPNELESYRASLTRTIFFWQNMFFAQNTGGYWDLAAQEIPLLHTWSLAVEEQFYILLPLGTFIAYKLGLRFKGIAILLIIFAIASFSLSQFAELIDERILKYNYYSLPTSRAGELLIGSLLAILTLKISNKLSNRINTILSIIAFITLLCSLIFMSDKLFFPSFWVAIPTLSVAVLIYANKGGGSLNSPNIISRFLSLSPMVFVGKISYSLYLWHWVVIVLYKKYYLLDTLGSLDLVIVIALSFALSTFSYYIIERPCRYNNLSFIKSAILFYVLPALVVSAIYVGDKKLHLFVHIQNIAYGHEKVKIIKHQLEYASMIRQDYCHSRIVGDCIFGDISKKPSVMLIGDSQAGHFAPLVESAGQMYGFSAKIFTLDGCYPFRKEDHRAENCNNTTQKAIDILDDYQTIMIAGYYGNDFILKDKMLEFINILKNRGKKVVIFKQVPLLDERIYNRIMRDLLRNKINYDKYKNILTHKEVKINQEIEKVIKGKAIFYDIFKDMNDEHKASFPFYNESIIYKDHYHLNYYGIQQIAKEVLPKQKDFWLNISGQK